ncbi:pyrroline-5-carboxylate reductase [Alkalihalobacillus sp. AL-G]|uniref:pyrroline-5-carboxylate reductase n=1 Tax=Alkalihalobacillus sp. AL-G TaxID=2926399 RepID=UPI00272B66E3|nr:pyrroline-5-carboxylate reductase [Alkalihalobacillus sp. AL-G]WLD91613.1 pyrroline-5-carboxylate reductase [Alkalihalobacillus sp. AL-G]
MESYRLLMIGAGRMAEAIISGLQNQNPSLFSSVTVANQTDERRLINLAKKYNVHTTTDWRDVINEVDVVVSAVPPQAHSTILEDLDSIGYKKLFITVAAGVDPTFMESKISEGTPVCWMMPNTAAQVKKSMTTYVCGRFVNDDHRTIIHHLLESIGDYAELSEEQVHDLTAVTGSAPAFLYLFCEALEEAAVSYGLDEKQAKLLVTKMISGSAEMLETGITANELRDQVTSPGGSTAAGVEVLEKGHFTELVQNAVKATNTHARGK